MHRPPLLPWPLAPLLLASIGIGCASTGEPPAPVARIGITTPFVTLTSLTETVRLTATTFAVTGRELTGPEVTWESSAPLVASVDASGLVTANDNGVATIRATSGSASAVATVTVAQQTATISLIGVPTSVDAVAPLPRILATLRDARGFPLRRAQPASLVLAENSEGAILVGPASVSAIHGVATFDGYWIDRAATPLRLSAVSGGVSSAPVTFSVPPHRFNGTWSGSPAIAVTCTAPGLPASTADLERIVTTVHAPTIIHVWMHFSVAVLGVRLPSELVTLIGAGFTQRDRYFAGMGTGSGAGSVDVPGLGTVDYETSVEGGVIADGHPDGSNFHGSVTVTPAMRFRVMGAWVTASCTPFGNDLLATKTP